MESLGLDIVDVERIDNLLSRYGPKFTNRILGQEEQAICDKRADKSQFLAGRFAAKEAIIKALGRFISVRPALRTMQIINDQGGQPTILFPSTVQKALVDHHCLISITHEKNMAAAVAVIMEDR